MYDWIDDEYAIQYMIVQKNYAIVSNMPLRLKCSCPVCGDSAKDATAARFSYYENKGVKLVHCYNCDYSNSFERFLRDHDAHLYEKYQAEKFKQRGKTRPTPIKQEKKKQVKKETIIDDLPFCFRLDKLPPNHPIIGYVKDRKIPTSQYNRLWFTDKWQELCNSVKADTYPTPKKEYRLVIPIFNKDGKIEAFQGRALKPAKNKYITIKKSDDSTKIFGLDLVDSTKPVFVMEGPIDSLFIKNSIAITGGSLNIESVPFKDTRIWVMDNEPRHPDTINRMNKLIELGERVCFWDQSNWSSKDINDMVKNEGAAPDEIESYILQNSESGLAARFRMLKYAKV